MSTFNRALLLANLLIGAFLLGSASSQSVSAVESNVITACANKTTGALRISSKCSKSERLITWNQTGPAGTDAYVNTKLVTIRYVGDGSQWATGCGDGKETFGSLFGFNAKTFDGYFTGSREYDLNSLTSNTDWTKNPYCSITLKVVQ